jgi:hypothetical protein
MFIDSQKIIYLDEEFLLRYLVVDKKTENI